MSDAPAIAPPAAAPAGPATEATAPTPSSATAGSGAWDALDALGSDDGAPTAPEKPAVAPARSKDPTSGKFVKATEKPVEPPKPAAPTEIDPSKMKAGELAKHYHALKKEKEEWTKKQADYETKLKTPAEWPEKKTYEERLAERDRKEAEYQKRVADYENELKFSAYERSQDCKDRYDKPLEDAWMQGWEIASSYKTLEKRDEADTVIEKSRKGTKEDFDALMQMDHDAAAEKAIELWGPIKGAEVLAARRAVFQKSAAKANAVKEYREKGAEREKVNREQYEKWQKDATAMVEREMQAAVEKYPQFFKADDADPKSGQLLEVGREALERVMRGGVPLKDGQKQWTNEELSRATAQIRNGAIAFPRVARSLSLALKEIKDLKTKLAEFEVSVPGNGDGRGRTPVAGELTPEQKLDAMATESRR